MINCSCPCYFALVFSVHVKYIIKKKRKQQSSWTMVLETWWFQSRVRQNQLEQDTMLYIWSQNCRSRNYFHFAFYVGQTSKPYFLMAQMVKSFPAVRETWVRYLDWEDPLEKEMATHSNILAWRNPWMEEPGGLQSMELQSRT